MAKPRFSPARPLSVLLGDVFSSAFARQGFASRELVTRWAEIAGPDIARHCEPLKLQWRRPTGDMPPEPATLVLRVDGPTALEVQHMAGIILERVNRFFGWQAVGRIALRQAPLSRPAPRRRAVAPEPTAIARERAELTAIENDELRTALARLAAAIKRK